MSDQISQNRAAGRLIAFIAGTIEDCPPEIYALIRAARALSTEEDHSWQYDWWCQNGRPGTNIN